MSLFKSNDGLVSSPSASVVATYNDIGRRMAAEQEQATTELIARGVKMEHPDDGWVDRQANTLQPCYPRFDHKPQAGDLIALGWPWQGYRLVECTQVEERGGVMMGYTRYHFTDTGQRVGGTEQRA